MKIRRILELIVRNQSTIVERTEREREREEDKTFDREAISFVGCTAYVRSGAAVEVHVRELKPSDIPGLRLPLS